MELLTCLVLTVCVLAVYLCHSPHDVVEGICLSPTFSRDQIVFALTRGNLLRSEDGGNSWHHVAVGPYWLSSVATSGAFSSDRTVFVGTYGGGLFLSIDGGQSWEPCNDGLEHMSIGLLAAPLDLASVYRLLVCTSAGDPYPIREVGHSWEVLFHDRCSALDCKLSSLYGLSGNTWQSLFSDDSGFTALAVTRSAILVGTDTGEVFFSEDDGRNFIRLHGLPKREKITCIHVPHYSGDGPIYVGTESLGVVKISGRGGHDVALGLRGSPVTSLSLGELDGKKVLLATTWTEALHYFDERRGLWFHHGIGLTKSPQADEPGFKAPHFKGIAASLEDTGNSTVFVGGFDGLFRSLDGLQSWQEVELLPIGLIVGLDLAPGVEGGFHIATTTYGGGSYKSPDGGNTWEVENAGLITTRLGPIAFSPDYQNDQAIFAGGEGVVLHKTSDGRAWRAVPLIPSREIEGSRVRFYAKLRAFERRLSGWLGVTITRKMNALFKNITGQLGLAGNYFVFPTVFGIPRDFAEHGTMFVGTRSHGLFCSVDRGRSYTHVWKSSSPVTALAASPQFGKDGTVFLSSLTGLYCSRNGGKNWERCAGEEGIRAARLAISHGYGRDWTVLAATPQGLFRTRAGDPVWVRIAAGGLEPDAWIDGVTLSPHYEEDRELLINVRGKGPYLSRNCGESFVQLKKESGSSSGFSHMTGFPDFVSLVAFSPTYGCDRTIVGSDMYDLWRSRDEGESWERILRPVRFENHKGVHYCGVWRIEWADGHSAMNASYSRTPGDEAWLTFHGKMVRWLGTRGPDEGMAMVAIDGQLAKIVDLYAVERENAMTVYQSEPLAKGLHSIRITVSETKNDRSTGRRVMVDALEICDAP